MDESPMHVATGLVWSLGFLFCGGLLGLCLAPIIGSVMRHRMSWVNAVRLAVITTFFAGILIRLYETYYVYHMTYREGPWPIAWWALYALAFSEVFSWAAKRAKL